VNIGREEICSQERFQGQAFGTEDGNAHGSLAQHLGIICAISDSDHGLASQFPDKGRLLGGFPEAGTHLKPDGGPAELPIQESLTAPGVSGDPVDLPTHLPEGKQLLADADYQFASGGDCSVDVEYQMGDGVLSPPWNLQFHTYSLT
jgi:hypothetical protein